jgi:hypothetical protein
MGPTLMALFVYSNRKGSTEHITEDMTLSRCNKVEVGFHNFGSTGQLCPSLVVSLPPTYLPVSHSPMSRQNQPEAGPSRLRHSEPYRVPVSDDVASDPRFEYITIPSIGTPSLSS